jgi:hypothetical protein
MATRPPADMASWCGETLSGVPRFPFSALRVGVCVIAVLATVAACGSAASDATARGAVILFNQDVANHQDAAACRLLTPTVRIIMLAADTGSPRPSSCAAALGSAAVRTFLAPLRMTRSEISRVKVLGIGDGLVSISPRSHATEAFVLSETAGRWMISGI